MGSIPGHPRHWLPAQRGGRGGTPRHPAPHRVALPNPDLHHTEHPHAFLTTQTPSLCTHTHLISPPVAVAGQRGSARCSHPVAMTPGVLEAALPASRTLQSETEPAPRWQGLLGSLLRTSPPPAGAGGGVGWRGLRRCPVWLHARRCLAIRGAARGRPRGRFGLWQLHEEEQEGTTYGYCIL